jgi:GNAT superfamily N-acetyltransferase
LGLLEELVSNADRITIELATSATDDVRALIDELDEILSGGYMPEQRHGLALDAIFEPHIRFFLARLNGASVGCGGVVLFADFAEVKRMYVRDVVPGHGVAQALLARIEKEARTPDLLCSGWKQERVRQRRSGSINGPGFKPAQHLAPMPQCCRRPSPPAHLCKSSSRRRPRYDT